MVGEAVVGVINGMFFLFFPLFWGGGLRRGRGLEMMKTIFTQTCSEYILC